MATITTIMSIKDKVTPSFKTMTGAVRDFTAHIESAGHMLDRTPSGISKAITKQKQLNKEFREGNQEAKELTNTIKGMAAAYLGLETFGQALKAFVGVSDTLTQIEARLEGIVGEGQALVEANEQIYVSAQRARTSYADMADFITRVGFNAKDAFKDMDELTTFAEIVNKQFVLAGTGSREAAMAMVQISQALASGVLRGEELNSVFEQAPGIMQSIATYMDVPIGQIREMASEGQLTSEIVKNAILSSASEVEERFNKMPLTWGQLWNQFVNEVTWGMRPLVGMFREVINTEGFRDAMSALAQGIGTAATAAGVLIRAFSEFPYAEEILKGLALVAGVVVTSALINMGHAGVMSCVNTTKAAFTMIGTFMAAHPVILLLITAFLATIATVISLGASVEDVMASIVGATMGAGYAVKAIFHNVAEGIKAAFANAFAWIVNRVLNSFMADATRKFASFISGIARKLENAGIDTHGLADFSADIANGVTSVPYYTPDYESISGAFYKGQGKGEALTHKGFNWLESQKDYMQSLQDRINQGMTIPQNVPSYTPVDPTLDTLEDIGGSSKETAENTKKVADNLKAIGFDLAMLKASFMDTAMRKIEQNVKLDINMPMTSTSDVDLDGFVNEFVNKVQSELENTSPMMGQTGVKVYG